MASRDERYAVPVYRFEEDGATCAQLADEDATEYIRVHYSDRHGDPSLRAIHHREDATDRYRFRVTDDQLGWCAYRGDERDLPVPIQHAVHAFGYGIRDLEFLSDRFFDFIEASAIAERLTRLAAENQGRPITRRTIDDAETGMNDLSLVLLARAVLPNDEYWTIWDTFIRTHAEAGVSNNVEFISHLWDTVLDSEDAAFLLPDGDGRLVPLDTKHVSCSAADSEYLLVDLIAPFGIQRFQFQETGVDTCIHQRRNVSRAPAPVIRAVIATGRTVDNGTSVAQSTSPVDVGETATQFCNEMRDVPLAPADVDRYGLDVAKSGAVLSSAATLHLKLHDMNREVADAVETELCDQLGVTDASEIPSELTGDLLTKIIASVPADLRTELLEYMDEHPAHVPPETATGRDDEFSFDR